MTESTFLRERLRAREDAGSLRHLTITEGLVDFVSNDYLGLARRPTPPFPQTPNGATGSRLLSGQSKLVNQLEEKIARFHETESALIFNSGYDANLGLISTLLREGDSLFYDEKIHASVHDGIRLARGRSFPFRHNDLEHLEARLIRQNGLKFVAVESLYSMDGDFAPLASLVEICERQNAHLIVDEAHTTGIYGTEGQGLVQSLGLSDRVFARLHTFGKALGCHGAAIVGSRDLKDNLVNFARPFIYSTALPPLSLLAIDGAYDSLRLSEISSARIQLQGHISQFRTEAETHGFTKNLVNSTSAIQAFIVGGNSRTRQISSALAQDGFDARAILSPTVPKDEERIRICLHSFNSTTEIRGLIQSIQKAFTL